MRPAARPRRRRRVSRSSSAASSRSPSRSRAAPVAIRSPLVGQLREAGGFAVEPKQAWTNVADFAARGLDALNLGPGDDPLCAHRRRARRDRRARPNLRRAPDVPARELTVELSPLLAELGQYPFARLDDWRAEARRRGIEVIDFGVGDPREPTPAFIREALVAGVPEVVVVPARGRAPRAIARRWPAGSQRDSASSSTRRSRSSRRSARRRRSSPSRRWRSAEKRAVAIPGLAYPVYERGALFAGASCITLPLREELGWLPDLDAVRPLGRARHVLDVLPEQPDRRHRPTLVLRGARRPGAGARLPALLGRGLLGALVRRGAGLGAAGRRPRRTSSSSTRSPSARR